MKFIKAHLAELISLIVTAVGLCVYCFWLFGRELRTVPGVAASVLCFGAYIIVLLLCIPGAIRFFSGRKETVPVDLLGERSLRRKNLHPAFRIFATVFVSRLLVLLAAYVVFTAVHGYYGSIFTTLKAVWYKTDTDIQHYINIAENWYSTSFPDALTLVFLPLYPMCMRAASLIIPDTFLAGMALNNLFSSAAGIVIYELALCDMGRRSSRFAVFCAFALPAAIFYTVPMSDALFLLLSSGCLLAMRKRSFLWAGVLGALASFTRSLGLLLVVPYAAEALAYCAEVYRTEREAEESDAGRSFAKRVAVLALCGLLICLGFAVYLLINKLIWGDWLKFMQFQRDNWYQTPGWFFSTADYQTEEMIKRLAEGDAETALGLWLPNLLYIFGALAVFVATARELRTSYVLYFAAYFAVSIGATWLLSAPRYLTALAVLPIAIAKLCESKDDGRGISRARAKSAAVAVVFIVAQAIYLVMYVMRYKLY